MSAKNTWISELNNDQRSFSCMVHRDRLGRIIDDVLRARPAEAARVRNMLPYEQIEFLRELAETGAEGIHFGTLSTVRIFLTEVEPHVESFRGAEACFA